MAHYRYTAKDKAGREVTGVEESPDERALINLLRKRELVIISVKPEVKKERKVIRINRGRKIKLSELVLFARQLATMIDSGIPLLQGLEILSEQIEDAGFKAIIADVKKQVSTGVSFNEALAKHPNAFSPLFINMVKAGESSGALDDIMERLAAYLEKTDSLARKVKSALTYPTVVSLMAVLITLVLMTKVVPVFESIFADFGGKLPMPTQILITISHFLINFFLVWAGGVVGGVFLLRRFLHTDKGTLMFDHFKLNMPVFGVIFKKVAVSKFSRTLSTLVKSGVPILSALEIVGKTAGNKVIENAVNKVRTSIREGENITNPLAESKVFPPLVCRMISVGEQTGELEKMLSKIADFYDDQVDAAVSGITSLIEPLVIAFLGIVIGTIVICMFLPIFKLSSLASN
ncbi:MAG: pilus assembly protein PilC [Candidatus Omnitrophica bacterium CG07_land_8_20_14_0_80_50_8]|nr:MAG: pilus assembly protein PilC [Candidatus Omnitrophica bacterium CG07_land_8_20_14_0_80_50_8]